MSGLSQWLRLLISAHEQGYRVDDRGNLLSPSREILLGHISLGYRCFSVSYEGELLEVRIGDLQAYQLYGEEMLYSGLVVMRRNYNNLDDCAGNIILGKSLGPRL